MLLDASNAPKCMKKSREENNSIVKAIIFESNSKHKEKQQ